MSPFNALPRLGLVSLLLLAGCADDTLNPLPRPTSSSPPYAPTSPSSNPAAPGTFEKRQMREVNPLGGPDNNYLFDGDFELSLQLYGGAQVGVRGFNSSGTAEKLIKAETGGLCFSGLHCAVMEANMSILFQGASPKEKRVVATLRAKPAPGSPCTVVTASLLNCDTYGIVRKMTPSDSADAAGWCRYDGKLIAQSAGTCIYLESNLPSGEVALIDAAVVGADDGTVSAEPEAKWLPSAETQARLLAVKDTLRRNTPPPRRESESVPLP